MNCIKICLYKILLLLVVITFIQPKSIFSQWNEIVNDSRGKSVYFNAWGGSPTINKYILDVSKRAKELYGINLVHVKVTDISETILRILAEKTSGNTNRGKVDLVWINGENFLKMLNNGLLAGPFLSKLPNFKYVDENNPAIKYDFSIKTSGFESPWGFSKLVFIYDTKFVNNPPKSAGDFLRYAKANPNRLTYPEPPDFTGTTFLKQMLYELVLDKEELLNQVNEKKYLEQTKDFWEWIDEITPYLWQKGKNYPKNAIHQRELLNQKEVDVTYSFAPGSAASDVINGDLPKSVRTYVADIGTIGNTHFVGIPFNSKVKNSASLVIANMLLSPEEQYIKFIPKNWGDYTVLDLNKLSTNWKKKFNDVDIGEQTLPPEMLGDTLPEPHPSWIKFIENDWMAKFK